MRCPVCTDTTLLITHREGIEIDYCPDCRGIWLDRGELDKLIERSYGAEIRSTPPPPSREQRAYEADRKAKNDSDWYEDDFGEKRKKRKKRKRDNFLEELFDFLD
jgi:Zn-finger nucleic acid-binding protein